MLLGAVLGCAREAGFETVGNMGKKRLSRPIYSGVTADRTKHHIKYMQPCRREDHTSDPYFGGVLFQGHGMWSHLDFSATQLVRRHDCIHVHTRYLFVLVCVLVFLFHVLVRVLFCLVPVQLCVSYLRRPSGFSSLSRHGFSVTGVFLFPPHPFPPLQPRLFETPDMNLEVTGAFEAVRVSIGRTARANY